MNRRTGHHSILLSASIRTVTRSCKKQFSATFGFSAASPASACRGEPQKTLQYFAVSCEAASCRTWSYRAWTRKSGPPPFKAPEMEQLPYRAWTRKGGPPPFKASETEQLPYCAWTRKSRVVLRGTTLLQLDTQKTGKLCESLFVNH